MRGLGLSAAAVAAMVLQWVGGANAADLDKVATKAPPATTAPAAPATCTRIQDFFTTGCVLAWYGVRLYGTVDVGYGYETNGAPFERLAAPGVNYFPGKDSLGGKWLPSPNALSTSNVGVGINEPLGAGWSFVGQGEFGFNPYSLELVNGVHSVAEMIGVPMVLQTSYGDANGFGTFYNQLGFAGVSNDTWGTLTFGRQNTLMADAILTYDPFGSSTAFSALGFYGSWAGGGDTENRKGTTALKYRVYIANYRFAVFAQIGGYEQGNGQRGAIQGDMGADFKVGPGLLSADVIVGHTKDAVGLSIIGPTDQFGNPINTTTPGFANAFMSATLSDNTNFTVAGKYAVERLKLFAGYEWVQLANPSDPFTVAHTGFTDIAGDFVCFGCVAINGTTINSTAFNGGDKIFQIAWFGGTYALTNSLDLVAAYYHEVQNDYSGGAKNAAGGTCAITTTALGSCAGSLDAASVLVDWRFGPKWDTYIGTLYSRLNGGLDSGFLAKDSLSTVAGIRFRW